MKKMNKYAIVTFVFAIMSLPLSLGAQSGSCTTLCSHNGCTVNLTQTSTNYTITTTCDDGYNHTETYDGDHTGTICGGVEACNLPEEA